MHSYTGQQIVIDIIAPNGFKQDGYESILRYETWKLQKCLRHFTHERTKIAEIKSYVTSGNFSISSIKALIEKANNAGIDEISWMCDTDYDSYVCLYIEEIKSITISEIEYMYDYKKYVSSTHNHNNRIWKDYQLKQRKREAEIAEYIRLKNIYEQEVG